MTTPDQKASPTGRLAKSEPNLQGIPVRTEEGRQIKEDFLDAVEQKPDCKNGGPHGPWKHTYMGSSCVVCGYFTY